MTSRAHRGRRPSGTIWMGLHPQRHTPIRRGTPIRPKQCALWHGAIAWTQYREEYREHVFSELRALGPVELAFCGRGRRKAGSPGLPLRAAPVCVGRTALDRQRDGTRCVAARKLSQICSARDRWTSGSLLALARTDVANQKANKVGRTRFPGPFREIVKLWLAGRQRECAGPDRGWISLGGRG
jgi:hypothetical protein